MTSKDRDWVCWEETGHIPISDAGGNPVTELDQGQVIQVVSVEAFFGIPRSRMTAVKRGDDWYADSHPERIDYGTIVQLHQEDGVWKSSRSVINKAALAKMKIHEGK